MYGYYDNSVVEHLEILWPLKYGQNKWLLNNSKTKLKCDPLEAKLKYQSIIKQLNKRLQCNTVPVSWRDFYETRSATIPWSIPDTIYIVTLGFSGKIATHHLMMNWLIRWKLKQSEWIFSEWKWLLVVAARPICSVILPLSHFWHTSDLRASRFSTKHTHKKHSTLN